VACSHARTGAGRGVFIYFFLVVFFKESSGSINDKALSPTVLHRAAEAMTKPADWIYRFAGTGKKTVDPIPKISWLKFKNLKNRKVVQRICKKTRGIKKNCREKTSRK
jgi:hypothetical protein